MSDVDTRLEASIRESIEAGDASQITHVKAVAKLDTEFWIYMRRECPWLFGKGMKED